VVNVEGATNSIRKSVGTAEEMAGTRVREVFVGIAGSHIKGMNSHGIHAIKSEVVNQEDIEKVFEAARAVRIPEDREIIDVLPQEYIVDGQRGISDPVGMVGIRLEANVHIVTASTSSLMNLKNCIARTGIDNPQILFQPLASAEAILTQEERNLGVALVDFGGGTTDIVIFVDGAVRHSSVLGIGGNNLTNDLSIGLRTPFGEAENIKIQYGSCMPSLISKDEIIDVPSVGGRKPRKIAHQVLAEILEPRVVETLNMVDDDIKKTGLADKLNAGIVFTGGSSLLSGLVETASQIFRMQSRIGFPEGIRGLNPDYCKPQYSTVVGLILHAHRYRFPFRSGAFGEGFYGKVFAGIRSLRSFIKDKGS
jgi:cell division protein FtsA